MLATSIISYAYPNASKPGLKLVAKRYVPAAASPVGLTLIFAHCTGAHKELWEPVIKVLCQQKDPLSGRLLIREAWSADWQTHGDSATANKDILTNEGLSVWEYAIGLRGLATSDYLSGHQLVGIGHSAGGSAMVLSTLFPPTNAIPYAAIVLVEPSLISRATFDSRLEEHNSALVFMQKAVASRRDCWANRDEARNFFETRFPWQTWDRRIMELSMEHGLRNVTMPEKGHIVNKVVLKCPKLHERHSYVETEPHFVAVERLGTLGQSVPIHYVLGARPDLVPKYSHDSVLGVRKMSSIQYVPDAGHFVLQENPDGVAVCLTNILRSHAIARSRL